MRTILLSKLDEIYLQKCATEHAGKIAYGIIIGQQAEADKLIVVHLAKNSEEDVDIDVVGKKEDSSSIGDTAQGLQSIDDIDTQALSNQWLSACKMIPGSFSVMGVFVSAVEKKILDERTFKVAKQLLNDINSLLLQGKSIYCSTVESGDSDLIFLVHSSNAKQTICKSFTHSSNGGSFTSIECRFVEKPFEWYTIECNYVLDEMFPVDDSSEKINIERQFQKSVEQVRKGLLSSEIFIHNECVEDTDILESFIKKKKESTGGNNQRQQQQMNTCFRAVIFQPINCQSMSESQAFNVQNFNGTIRFCGIISSRIHCNPRNLIADVKRFVRDDIVRSLVARIQVYCDALTDPNISNKTTLISEPPRRVYFNLPNGSTASQIQFSEYIFRGEAPTVAVAQAKQILDLEIDTQNIVDNLEGLPDDDVFNEPSTENSKSTTTNATERTTKTFLSNNLLIIGIAVSIFILVLSIVLHFFFKS